MPRLNRLLLLFIVGTFAAPSRATEPPSSWQGEETVLGVDHLAPAGYHSSVTPDYTEIPAGHPARAHHASANYYTGQLIYQPSPGHRNAQRQLQQQQTVPIYYMTADGRAVSLPCVMQNNGQMQPIIIIQQPAAAPLAPVNPAASAAAVQPAPQAADTGKQPFWKSAVTSLTGNAGSLPGGTSKVVQVAAPVLNAILQGF